jgi:hypothetical protein
MYRFLLFVAVFVLAVTAAADERPAPPGRGSSYLYRVQMEGVEVQVAAPDAAALERFIARHRLREPIDDGFAYPPDQQYRSPRVTDQGAYDSPRRR